MKAKATIAGRDYDTLAAGLELAADICRKRAMAEELRADQLPVQAEATREHIADLERRLVCAGHTLSFEGEPS
jgi:hypothetical protein